VAIATVLLRELHSSKTKVGSTAAKAPAQPAHQPRLHPSVLHPVEGLNMSIGAMQDSKPKIEVYYYESMVPFIPHVWYIPAVCIGAVCIGTPVPTSYCTW
jgi:hypothetical protein